MNPSRLKLAALAALMLAAGSACATPPDGSDGDLVNQWPAMAAPVQWQPKAEGCHTSFTVNLTRGVYSEVACADFHAYQTVHVGEITGEAAGKTAPPEATSAAYKAAWVDCDARLTAFLGGQWRDRRLRLRVAVPPVDAWASGARWYACTTRLLEEKSSNVDGVNVSLIGRFDKLASLKIGCYDLPEKGEAAAKECDEPHNTEFVGHFTFDDMSWADLRAELAKDYDRAHRLCQALIAKFAGVSARNGSLSGTWVWNPAEEDWNAGDRTMRCFLWLNKVEVSKSLKGVGAPGWPLK